MQDPQIHKSLEIIYDFLSISDPLQKADAIFVAGGSTLGPTIKAAEIFKQGWSNKIFITAKRGRFTNPDWKENEAVIYKNKLLELGIPEEALIINPISTNTPDEARDSIQLMKQSGVCPKLVILVDRPIHQRREWATFEKSHNGSGIKFLNCPADEPLVYTQESLDRAVAEIKRLKKYADKGDLVEQVLPVDVVAAVSSLENKVVNFY